MAPSKHATRSTDPIQILPAELIIQIFQYEEIAVSMSPYQVSRLWRNTLSEGPVIDEVLRTWYSDQDPALLCESTPIRKLEVMQRFRTGKPARIVKIDLSNILLDYRLTDLRIVAHHALIELDHRRHLLPGPSLASSAVFLVNLLTGGSMLVSSSRPADARRVASSDSACIVYSHEGFELNVLNLSTLKTFSFSFTFREKWRVRCCSAELIFLREEKETRHELTSGCIRTLVFSSTTGRSCLLELDLASVLPHLRASKVMEFDLLHAYFLKTTETICLVYIVSLWSRDDTPVRATKAVYVSMNVANSLENWELELERSVTRMTPILVKTLVDGQRDEVGMTVQHLERHLSWTCLLRPYDNIGVSVSDYGNMQILANMIKGNISFKRRTLDPVDWRCISSFKGVHFERDLESPNAVHVSNDIAGNGEERVRTIQLQHRFRENSDIDRKAHHVDASTVTADQDDVKIIVGNDRFMVTLINNDLVIMSFDPGWSLEAEDFEPLKPSAHDIFRDVATKVRRKHYEIGYESGHDVSLRSREEKSSAE